MGQLILAEFRDSFDEGEKKKAGRLLCPLDDAPPANATGLFYV